VIHLGGRQRTTILQEIKSEKPEEKKLKERKK
jgi:hypothetical protein